MWADRHESGPRQFGDGSSPRVLWSGADAGPGSNGGSLRAPSEEQDRIDEPAEKCNEGTLSDGERSEYEDYVRAIHFLGIVQAKARAVLLVSRQPSIERLTGPTAEWPRQVSKEK